MTEAVPLVYDPDVYSGSVCHLDLGPHKHGPEGPEAWSGLVMQVPMDGGQPMMRWNGEPPRLVRKDSA